MAKRRNISGRTLRKASPTNVTPADLAGNLTLPRTYNEGFSISNIFGDIGDAIHPGITAKIENDLGLRNYTDEELQLLFLLGILPFGGKIAKAGMKGVNALNKASRLPAKGGFLLALPTHERNAHGRFKVDEKRTKEVNKYLKETVGPRMKKEGYNPYTGSIVKKEPLTIKDYDSQLFFTDLYKDLEPYRNDIIVSEGKGTPYYANTLSSHRLPTRTYNNAAWDLSYPKYPHQMEPEFAAKRYNPDYIQSTIDDRKITAGDNYNYTMGELDNILKKRASARNLYEADYPYSPYNSWGSYAKELEAKGITGSDYDEIMKLAREYERILYDESLDMNSKMNKLNTLKTNIETLESLGGLK